MIATELSKLRKFKPNRETTEPPVVGALGVADVITGESYVNRSGRSPLLAPLMEMAAVCCRPAPAATWRTRALSEIHEDVTHCDCPMRGRADESPHPKLMPCIVSGCDPKVATFNVLALVKTGGSYEKLPTRVPTLEPTVSLTSLPGPTPLPRKHVISVGVLHDDVWQAVLPTLAVGVMFITPKLSPVTVTLKLPDVAPFS